jgi:uncharacterized protein YecT (DUF1311 family)
MNARQISCSIVSFGLALLVLACNATAQQKKKSDPCSDTSATTQAAMNECAQRNRDRAEARMQKLLKRLHAEGTPAQKAWEAYRDAQLKDFYPDETLGQQGSIFPLCLVLIETKLIEGRIRDIQALTIKYEGEGCIGFVLEGRGDRLSRVVPTRSKNGKGVNLLLCKDTRQDQSPKQNVER